ncbi:uncharacterized protein ATNIH1004_006530 [Aspergillus tanneri]|uniref:Uncharacterized protein n=1 Tax=Aspergillus tanneri TaxID=1220188 RepID=A0A5M9MLE2_9EURO|nr:uncharacterized protein ATNIH1004_006530 [Aspergillus tanneri]KAA8647828.1 hypothetical protein ATNIH1004_006530 [Aspergillus tanneri]
MASLSYDKLACSPAIRAIAVRWRRRWRNAMLTCCFRGGMILRFTKFEQVLAQDLRDVLHPELAGTWNLHEDLHEVIPCRPIMTLRAHSSKRLCDGVAAGDNPRMPSTWAWWMRVLHTSAQAKYQELDPRFARLWLRTGLSELGDGVMEPAEESQSAAEPGPGIAGGVNDDHTGHPATDGHDPGGS